MLLTLMAVGLKPCVAQLVGDTIGRVLARPDLQAGGRHQPTNKQYEVFALDPQADTHSVALITDDGKGWAITNSLAVGRGPQAIAGRSLKFETPGASTTSTSSIQLTAARR